MPLPANQIKSRSFRTLASSRYFYGLAVSLLELGLAGYDARRRQEQTPHLILGSLGSSHSVASIFLGSGTHAMIGQTITHNKTLEGATENESRVRIAVEK